MKYSQIKEFLETQEALNCFLNQHSEHLDQHPEWFIVTVLNEDSTDTTVLQLVSTKGQCIIGEPEWSIDLDESIAKVEGSNLVFLQHYEGDVTITATYVNASMSKTINVVCDETWQSTKYVLDSITPLSNVPAEAVDAQVEYVLKPVYYYQHKVVYGEPFSVSHVVEFETNETEESITRSGSFTDDYDITIDWEVI